MLHRKSKAGCPPPYEDWCRAGGTPPLFLQIHQQTAWIFEHLFDADEEGDSALAVDDESHLHAGHAGAKSGKGHFAVRIVSDSFDGQRLIARHRAVYGALGDYMTTDIHALSISAKTPAEAGE